MAYSNSTSDRMDELRFRSQQASRNDASMLGLVSPPRNGNRMPQSLQPQESRGGLTRRFTTDSGRVPTIASITNQRTAQESQEYGPSVSQLNLLITTIAIVLQWPPGFSCYRKISSDAVAFANNSTIDVP